MFNPRRLRLQGLALTTSVALAASAAFAHETAIPLHPLQGEWATEAGLCDQSRLSFTADGRHESLWRDEGEWKVHASGTYKRDGSRLEIHIGETHQVRQIISVDDQFLVLRNDDQSMASALDGDAVTLYRCPKR